MSAAEVPPPEGEGAGIPTRSGPAEPEAILADIAATREQLGRTVDELSRRLDVPARARERVGRARETALDVYLENPPAVMGGALALAVLALSVIIWRRKRAHTRRNR